MKKIRILLGLTQATVLLFLSVAPAFASTAGWQKGAAIYPNSNNDFSTDAFKQSIQKLKGDNANYVSLVIPYGEDNVGSANIWPAWNKPSDTDLGAAIDYAHSIGLQVNLKPQVYPSDGQWSAFIDPGDTQGWFRNYESVVLHPLALLAAQHKVEQITIGTELSKMTQNSNPAKTQGWNTMIANMRAVYHGLLTYSAQHDFPQEIAQTDIFYNLDSIGISAYHPLDPGSSNPSQTDIENAWDQWNSGTLKWIQQKFNKPILFTEIGYRSVDGAHNEPASYWQGGGYNPGEQNLLYTSLFDYWSRQPNFQGVQLWDWKADPNAGGPGNTDFTVQNKPAEQIVKTWFGADAGGTTPPPPPPSTPPPAAGQFMATAQATPANPSVNQAVTVTATVTNTASTAASDILVDLEIYSPSGQQVYQKYFEHQNFTGNQALIFTGNWTPTTTANYTVKLGVFSANWSSNYKWNDSAATISVGAFTPPPPATSPAGSIDVWWIADGSTVSGVQPLKALLKDTDISKYTMYWQVDNDALNLMGNSMQDYPHKEAVIDVSGWNWHSDNKYSITFTAKDLNGQVVARRTVVIMVTH